jgi:hypothetical protein
LSVRILITTKINETPGEKNTQKSMYSLNQLKTLVSCGRDPARSLPLRRGFLLIPLILVCFAFSPKMQAVPAPETPDPGSVGGVLSTADGVNALAFVTSGVGNSAFGAFSQFAITTGNFNTAVGAGSLDLNNADSNTAVGTAALLLNTFGAGAQTGTQNTAVGTAALEINSGGGLDSEGSFNGAVGAFALATNTTGFSNNAVGNSALFNNNTGAANTALGDLTLVNGSGDDHSLNTAVGAFALFGAEGAVSNSNNAVGVDALTSNLDGGFNNVMGVEAMNANASGSGNVAIGDSAGAGVEGSFNIYIGFEAGPGGGAENETIRIGDTLNTACFIGGISGVVVTGDPVLVDANGQLGVGPVGSPLSAKEILKERQVVQELKATTERQAAVIALQEGQIKALTAGLKQQADQIQKVSAQLEMIRPTPRVVENR